MDKRDELVCVRVCLKSGLAVRMIPGDRCYQHGAAAQPCETAIREIPRHFAEELYEDSHVREPLRTATVTPNLAPPVLCWSCGKAAATTTRPNALGVEKPRCEACARLHDAVRRW